MSKTENQPMTILEAMACGLPIVGVDMLGVPELVKGNGFIAKPDDYRKVAEHIINILVDGSLRKKLSKKSLDHAKDYSIEAVVDQTEKLYESMLKRKKKWLKI